MFHFYYNLYISDFKDSEILFDVGTLDLYRTLKIKNDKLSLFFSNN